MSTTNEQANKNAKGVSQTFQIVVFRLGTEEYALNIDQIKEVVPTPAVTRMPQSPDHIRGVANIRGNIIAIVDLEDRFGMNQASKTGEQVTGKYTLVVESDVFKMGILVREVPNTLAISETAIDQSVMNVEGENNYIKGIVKLDSRLIILIDIFKVMQAKELVQAFGKSVAA
jgi:purine-binding chemotaxis protein CheW